jgi:uncharacterized protein (TIGR03435 family)
VNPEQLPRVSARVRSQVRNRRALSAGVVAVAAVCGGAAIHSQTPAAGGARPAFEVASIKRNVSGSDNASVRALPGGRVTVTNNTLRNLIRNVYRVPGNQLVGGPDWIDRDRWDIVAKAADDAPPERMLLMLDTLLVDRFKVVTHREQRIAPIYALVMARQDNRPGPQLRPSATDCAAWMAELRARGGAPPAPGSPVRCGVRFNGGSVVANAALLSDFARNLAGLAGRTVVDQTGLTGTYDLELTWTPDSAPGEPSVGGAAPSEGGSLFTALQEQLGLKLEAQRAPLEFVVIDSAERPAED